VVELDPRQAPAPKFDARHGALSKVLMVLVQTGAAPPNSFADRRRCVSWLTHADDLFCGADRAGIGPTLGFSLRDNPVYRVESTERRFAAVSCRRVPPGQPAHQGGYLPVA